MGSQGDKFLSAAVSPHGFDDIGAAEPAGTISAIGDSNTASGRWRGKLLLTVNSTAALKRGQAIRISALDSGHNGLTRILAIVSSTKMIVNITYNALLVDAIGVWSVDGGGGAWDGFIPLGVDIIAGAITLTFWAPEKQGSDEDAVPYTKDVFYPFPGIIKTAQITGAYNVRLVRSATNRPFGKDAQ